MTYVNIYKHFWVHSEDKERDTVIINRGPDYNEKRLFCRMSVKADLTFSLPGDNTPHTGQCRNLSHSGIQFETDKALEQGATLEITIDTKSEKFKPMKVIVRILRAEPVENGMYKVAAKILEYT